MDSNRIQRSWLRAGMTFVVLVILAVCSTEALSWYTGPTATYEEWSFSTWNYGPVTPDTGWDNDFGTPQLVVSTASQWSSSVGEHDGVWTLSGEMDFIIPNYPDTTRSEKEILVEVTWKGAGLSYLPDKPLLGIECDYDEVVITRTDTVLSDGWTTTLFKLSVYPNPSTEWIVLKGDIMVDSVIINTICIPEPATLGLLIGGAFMAIRRSRKLKD